MDDIYACALDAIIRAFDCQRASILLFDTWTPCDLWHGAGCQTTIDMRSNGHSPWQRDSNDVRPISVSDIAKSDLPEDLKQVVPAEGIGALSFIPLEENRRLLGKFMVYYDQPHALATRKPVSADDRPAIGV